MVDLDLVAGEQVAQAVDGAVVAAGACPDHGRRLPADLHRLAAHHPAAHRRRAHAGAGGLEDRGDRVLEVGRVRVIVGNDQSAGTRFHSVCDSGGADVGWNICKICVSVSVFGTCRRWQLWSTMSIFRIARNRDQRPGVERELKAGGAEYLLHGLGEVGQVGTRMGQ